MKIALICGGPSLERGISLNSARSVLDHLGGDGIEILPIYFDHKKKPYAISTHQLYSNTPSDFDFKLKKTAKTLSKTQLKALLKSCDLAFPVMHGAFGEDGQIQRILEQWKVPIIGSDAKACRRCFDKFDANSFIAENGFFTLPSVVLKIYHKDHEKLIQDFFKRHQIKKAVVKMATGGSSIGVFPVHSPKEALEKVQMLFSKRMDTRVVIEPFCEGKEFTVILLQNRFGQPVAVLPTEIEVDYAGKQFFDFRRKYLPSNQVRYHCPPRFDNAVIEKIQVQAEQLFTLLGMRDFARFDGWLMPDGNLWFSDFNPISGMEQNSFLFQQASRIGLSHRDLFKHILRGACQRYGLKMPKELTEVPKRRKPVHVIFGGETSERQVSLMSGTNAWLKLKRSKKYEPKPFFLDPSGKVWTIPYGLLLNHTVEEIWDNCLSAEENEKRLAFLEEKVRLRLALPKEAYSEPFFLPKSMSLEKFVKEAPFAFIGLHGGIGENGVLQGMLTKSGVKFNGSGEKASGLCMNKFEIAKRLERLEGEGIFLAAKKLVKLDLIWKEAQKNTQKIWTELCRELGAKTVIVKPVEEGCSSGVVRLFSAQDLHRYLDFAHRALPQIPMGTFKHQSGIVEMPPTKMKELLFEKFIQTDLVKVIGNSLKWRRLKGWIEVTIGVLQEGKHLRALSPSLTVAEGAVLSVEEKFQGGTGINMTPPPEEIVSPKVLQKVKRNVQLAAEKLGIEGYARMDTFVNVDTGDIIFIEINTTPALTPSTVLYHQALCEEPAIEPVRLLEKLIENKGY